MVKPFFLKGTFHIRCGNKSGTAFALNYEGWQYLVTALHVIEDISENMIEVFHDGSWKTLAVEIIGKGSGEIDVAVLSSSVVLGPKGPNEELVVPSSTDMKIGQQLYLLGFPLGMMGASPYPVFPLPLVKSGILSGVDKWHGTDFIYVDCYANRGFSGGPLIYYQDQEMPPTTYVVGVMFRFEPDQDGRNSGIGVAVDIRHAISLIHSNPRIPI